MHITSVDAETLKDLYHCTAIRNESLEEYFAQLVENGLPENNANVEFPLVDYRPLPEYGSFSTRLDIEKFFTTTELCTVEMPCDWVYLKYTTTRPIRLFNLFKYFKDYMRTHKHSNWKESWDVRCHFRSELRYHAKELNIDGVMNIEGCMEICLFHADACVSPDYVILPQPTHTCTCDRLAKYSYLKLT